MFGVNLSYSWRGAADQAQPIDEALFAVLYVIHKKGSLSQAAKEVGMSYRHVWGLMGKWEHLLGQPLALMQRGRGAALTPLGERLLWAEQRARARLAPQLESLSFELQREFAAVLGPTVPRLTIHASHDIVLAQLRDLLAGGPGLQIDLSFQASAESLAALARGRCDLAGFHVADGQGRASLTHMAFRQWLRPRRHRLLRFVTRQQGLMVAPRNPSRVRTLEDLTRPGVRFVNRQQGSGTRLQFDQLLWEAGIQKNDIQGYAAEEFTHLAVAATIAGGQADAGFGIRAAAARFGLDFVPLVNERYFLACTAEMAASARVSTLVNVLRSPEFMALVGSLPGYDAAEAGQIVDLRDALPWFDTDPGAPRRRRPEAPIPDPSTSQKEQA